MATVSPTGGTTSIDQLININQPGSSSSSSTSASNPTGVSENEFLQLLTAQLQNQDPTQPMDDTQSVAELAQFSSLQSQEQLTQSFQNFQNTFAVMQASSLIGKEVTVNTTAAGGNSSSVTGTVAGVTIVNGAPSVTLTDSNGNPVENSNGAPLYFPTTEITGVQ